jgi:hypothetical protein
MVQDATWPFSDASSATGLVFYFSYGFFIYGFWRGRA